MQKVTFENAVGESVVLSLEKPFILNGLDGVGSIETDVQIQKAPYQDGGSYLDTTIESRQIVAEVTIMGSTKEDIFRFRRKLSQVLNPKLGVGKIKYENAGGIKEIQCVVDSPPYYPIGGNNHSEAYQKTTFSFLAPDPYWTTPNITEEPTFQPLFQFPFEGEFEMGIQRDQRIIINNGDAAAPLQIEFYGPAVNPVIMNNTTGEFIKVNRTLGEDEYMRINTDDANVKVEFVAADGTAINVLNWIDLESEFFKLVVGENDIEYSADSDIQGAIVNISYRKLYVGI